MEGAQSELIVPSGHPAHQNPQAIEEVYRILEFNAQSPNRSLTARSDGQPLRYRADRRVVTDAPISATRVREGRPDRSVQ